MISTSNPEINVEDLMQRIRSEVKQRKMYMPARYIVDPVVLPRMPETVGNIKLRDCYAVSDFLVYQDEDFVHNAFRGVLRREADADGFVFFLTSLRNGSLSKLEILEQLRNSPEGNEQNIPVAGLLPDNIAKPVALPKLPESSGSIEHKKHFTISDFLNYQDEDFVRNVFRGVLGREADVTGYLNFLDLLRSGTFSKLEILGAVRYSPEGKAKKITIDGLFPRYFLKLVFRIPVLGYFLFLASTLIRLPRLVKNLQRLEANVNHQQSAQRAQLNGLLVQIDDSFQIAQEQVAEQFHLIDKSLASAHGVSSIIRHHIHSLAEQIEDTINLAQQRAVRQYQTMGADMAQVHADVDDVRQLVQAKADGSQVTELVATATRLGEELAQKASVSQVEALAEQCKADAAELTATATRLGEELAQKASVSQVEALAEQCKADAAELTATATRLGEELAQKASVSQVEALAEQCKADAAELTATATRLGEELAQKASGPQVEALATQTGEKIFSLTQALETKAGNEHLTQLTNHLVDLLQHKADVTELAATATRLGEALAQKADAATNQRETQEIQRQILDHKHNILDQQRRLALLLEEARKRLPEPISTEQIENMVAEEDHLLDAFYVSFEDRFRGTREDIKQRVSIYLPIVKEAKAGTKNAPILDIGCGRGEWLLLLQENELVARGVDLNRVMVSQCQELGLDVSEADAMVYLRNLKANSLGAVTGVHIIEHIPFKRLVALYDEVLRVLKPGGVAIFETPNPENLVVGACNFYYDPTHLNPLPPELMRFVMEARGFGRIEILRLHPQPESAWLREGGEQVQQIVNGLIFGAQDYALVAYKS